jgi:hypothetical protein
LYSSAESWKTRKVSGVALKYCIPVKGVLSWRYISQRSPSPRSSGMGEVQASSGRVEEELHSLFPELEALDPLLDFAELLDEPLLDELVVLELLDEPLLDELLVLELLDEPLRTPVPGVGLVCFGGATGGSTEGLGVMPYRTPHPSPYGLSLLVS